MCTTHQYSAATFPELTPSEERSFTFHAETKIVTKMRPCKMARLIVITIIACVCW